MYGAQNNAYTESPLTNISGRSLMRLSLTQVSNPLIVTVAWPSSLGGTSTLCTLVEFSRSSSSPPLQPQTSLAHQEPGGRRGEKCRKKGYPNSRVRCIARGPPRAASSSRGSLSNIEEEIAGSCPRAEDQGGRGGSGAERAGAVGGEATASLA